MRLRWSRQARDDLLEIGRYISRDNPVAARRWVERLRQRARQAAELPLAGRVVPEYSLPNLREVLVRSYRIIYLVGENAIELLTVFEGHHLFSPKALPEDEI